MIFGTYAYAVDAKLRNPLGDANSDVFTILNKGFTILVQVVVVFATLAIIYAGFLYVTAGGDEAKIKKAHSVFMLTVVGTLVLLGARVIASVLSNTIGEITGGKLGG